MKRSFSALFVVALLALQLSAAGVSAAPSSSAKVPMTIKVLSVTPNTITKQNQLIVVRVRYTGVAMDPLHIGKVPVRGHGHMQVYLDKIPSAAYRFGIQQDVVVVASTATFHFVLSPHWRKAARGHHRFLVALAQNDNILYRVNAGSFSLTVK